MANTAVGKGVSKYLQKQKKKSNFDNEIKDKIIKEPRAWVNSQYPWPTNIEIHS